MGSSDRSALAVGRAWPRITAAVAAICVSAAPGCGESGQKKGFSSGDRAAAAAAPGALEHTNIATTLVDLTNTAGTVPAYCRIHATAGGAKRFDLFILWRPSKRTSRGTYIWFRATLANQVAQDTFRSGYEPLSTGLAGVLHSQAGDAFTRPSESCEILMNGDVRLLA
jgi:hypothetical protein